MKASCRLARACLELALQTLDVQCPSHTLALTAHGGHSLPAAAFAAVVQSLVVWLLVTPGTRAREASLNFTISRTKLKPMSIELVMLPNHLILCHPFLLLPSVFPSIRVFSNVSALYIRWPKDWSFSVSPSNEYSWLISFRIDLTPWSPRDFQVFPSIIIWKHQFFGAQPSLRSNSHIYTWLLEKL